jgi:hypothetical protein
MRHPSNRDLAQHVFDPKQTPSLQAHITECEECRGRIHSFLRAIEEVSKHEVPTLTHEEVEDVFATAWRSSRRPEPRPFPPLWRWVLQPAALFSCGLLAGFLAFASQPQPGIPVVTPPVEIVQVSTPHPSPEAPISATPLPAEPALSPAVTPGLNGQSGKDFWEMAGLRNVKLTPTRRYEDGKVVNGARLEGETLNGALVVMAF